MQHLSAKSGRGNIRGNRPENDMGLSAFFAALARTASREAENAPGSAWQVAPSGALRLAAPEGRRWPGERCPITAVAWTERNMAFPLDRWQTAAYAVRLPAEIAARISDAADGDPRSNGAAVPWLRYRLLQACGLDAAARELRAAVCGGAGTVPGPGSAAV